MVAAAHELDDARLDIVPVSRAPTLEETRRLSAHFGIDLIHDGDQRLLRHYRPAMASATIYVYDARGTPREMRLNGASWRTMTAMLRGLLAEHPRGDRR